MFLSFVMAINEVVVFPDAEPEQKTGGTLL